MLKNVMEINPQKSYVISYSIPSELIEEFDMYIEECVGADGIAILDDVTENETEKGINGTVSLSFDDDHPFDADYLYSVATTLEELTKGNSLIEV